MKAFNLLVTANNGISYTPSKFKNGFCSLAEATEAAKQLSITLYGRVTNNVKVI